jgi:hypothetical protein
MRSVTSSSEVGSSEGATIPSARNEGVRHASGDDGGARDSDSDADDLLSETRSDHLSVAGGGPDTGSEHRTDERSDDHRPDDHSGRVDEEPRRRDDGTQEDEHDVREGVVAHVECLRPERVRGERRVVLRVLFLEGFETGRHRRLGRVDDGVGVGVDARVSERCDDRFDGVRRQRELDERAVGL